MNASREKWNHIYASNKEIGSPAAVLTDNQEHLPTTGRALDIACGRGANAIFLANHGLEVDAWDISDTATTRLAQYAAANGLALEATAIDISPTSFEPETYDVIVNCHYLDRGISASIRSSLKQGGTLFFQTFTADKQIDAGPTNPDFLLGRHELRKIAAGMTVVVERDEGTNTDPNNPLAGRAYIVAQSTG
jgi:tellurite methyltransferase